MSSGKYRKEHDCLNCGSHVEKHYCSNCGQPNLELKENFWAFIMHSIAHYFHFENKFFQTLKPLLLKPGQVTLDYLAGKRARYINPVSMYIFVSIVYFLVAYSPERSSSKHRHTNGKETNISIDSAEKTLNSTLLLQQNSELLTAAKKEFAQELSKERFRNLDFKTQEGVLADLEAKAKIDHSDSLRQAITKFAKIHNNRNDSTYNAYLSRQSKLTEAEKDNWLKRLYKKRSLVLDEKSELINETLEHNRPKQYFLLMPLLALFIMMNFRKNNINYLDHLIFTIHGMTAYFIIQIITQPFIKYVFNNNGIISTIIGTAVFAWACWYMYKALELFYQRKKLIFKMFVIICLYAIALKTTEVIMQNIIYYIAT